MSTAVCPVLGVLVGLALISLPIDIILMKLFSNQTYAYSYLLTPSKWKRSGKKSRGFPDGGEGGIK